jgi:hypothetical protein
MRRLRRRVHCTKYPLLIARDRWLDLVFLQRGL